MHRHHYYNVQLWDTCMHAESDRIKIALFFQLCPFITHDPFITTTLTFYHILQNLMENLLQLTEC